MMPRPLEGLLVLDFSQFLSGPYAGLRLADLGARVIKIERLDCGDLCRRLYISNLELDGDSTLFHSINRNKESYAVDLKSEADRCKVRKLLSHADMMVQNFRPGVIEKLGFGYEEVKAINPRLIYGSISGYGGNSPLRDRPGQDLLLQALTGLPWLHRDKSRRVPIPFGLAIADMITGAHLVQGMLAALVRRSIQGSGAFVEVNMLASTLDAMQEIWEEKWMPDRGSSLPVEGAEGSESIRWLKGLYPTAAGYIALGDMPLHTLAQAIAPHFTLDTLGEATAARMEELLTTRPAHYWSVELQKAGIPCEELLDWMQLMQEEAFRELCMTQDIYRSNGARMTAISCPIRLNGHRLQSSRGAPRIGEHNAVVESEWNITR